MKVISFSLWGNDPKYTVGAIRNGELAPKIYPGWTCRFHIGDGVPEEITSELLKLGEVVRHRGCDWGGMFWRFLDAGKYDAFISRDTDSRLGLREKAAVDEWIKSGKDYHIMRDHPAHAFKILGGMWGCRAGNLGDIEDLINSYHDKREYYQVDQNFLKEVVWGRAKDNSLVHDPIFEKKPFPTKRVGFEFVGEVYDENESLNKSHTNGLKDFLKT